MGDLERYGIGLSEEFKIVVEQEQAVAAPSGHFHQNALLNHVIDKRCPKGLFQFPPYFLIHGFPYVKIKACVERVRK